MLVFNGCNDKGEKIVPAALTGLSIASDSPGTITIRWSLPNNVESIRYIRVDYYDPRLKKDVLKTASVYSDSMVINDTRLKYGEYTFKVHTVSPSGEAGNVQELKIVSLPAEPTYIATIVPLTAGSFSTGMQSTAEGPVGNLADDAGTTYFHSDYSGSRPPAPHWFQVNLGTDISSGYFRFWYQNRANANNKPTDFDLLGSTDAQSWFLIRNFTLEADGLNVANGGQWTSGNYAVPQPFRYLRFSVNQTNNNTDFFTMAVFKFYTVVLIDPEAPDSD